MSTRYSGGWEGRGHYEWWVRWRVDEDWDRDTDPPARLVLAWFMRTPNVVTAASCLLNQWERKDQPEAWDRALGFLGSRPEETKGQFESAAEAFLEEIAHLAPGTSMQGDKDARDRRLEVRG